MDNKVILTPEGKQKLVEELAYREGERREEITQSIKTARDFGDLSENSEYDDARDEQGKNEGRIIEIKAMLSNGVVQEAPTNNSVVSIGHRVTVDINGRERVFHLVGTSEADPAQGRISNESPLGGKLVGHKVGDEIDITTPAGKVMKYVIKGIA